MYGAVCRCACIRVRVCPEGQSVSGDLMYVRV